MFTEKDNEELTRVGPGTLMGDLMRRYWMPFLLPEELPEPDCHPIRVRLLGEDLIAFRDTNGKLGLLDRFCPHRRVDLFFARNEECGLRCVYHGWKYDVDGNVLDMPAEPANSALRTEIKIKSYPMLEWGGLIWAYMGDLEHMPSKPPELEWGSVPKAHRHIGKRLQESNYAQAVEGGIDSSHVSVLHSLLDPAKAGSPFRERQISIDPKHKFFASDTAPKFFVRPQPYGLRIGARRVASEEEYYWRITQFLAPFFTMIAPGHESNLLIGHAWTPIDDNNCWTFTFFWDRDNPLKDRGQFDSTEIDVPVQNDGSYRPICNQKNSYGIDRDIQRLHTTTGIKGIGLQDSAIQESMGPIVDRSKEHLASSDSAIIAFRKLLLNQARQLRKSGELDLAKKPELYKVRSAGIILPKELDFEEVTRRSMAIS